MDIHLNVIAQYAYDAWGNVLYIKNANGANITDGSHIAHINPIRYRSYYYDTETGYYYLQSRYYNPEIGRFINMDDISAVMASDTTVTDKNLYAYCDNNPVMRIDDDGEFWKKLKEVGLSCCKVAAAVAVIGASLGVTAIAIGGTISSGGVVAAAIPVAIAVSKAMVATAVSIATVGVTAGAVGEVGSTITSRNSKTGDGSVS